MTQSSGNYKKIAKNTFLLYTRMGILMLFSLFTSRLLLQILGFENYGIYNLVGGIVILFSFLNTALSGATQRFLSYSLGNNSSADTQTVFSIALTLHIIISIILLILSETIGLWFFYEKLNIPDSRFNAAIITYQLSILITIINIMRVPYNSIIISYEKMDFFAYLSLIECLIKFIPIIIIPLISFDELVIYAILLTVANVIIYLIYYFYCRKSITTARFSFKIDKNIFKEMLSFTGWNTISGIANITRNQGLNIIINLFMGVVVNAAVGIANQVSSQVNQFMSNFLVAYSPQLTISYAKKEYQELYKMINFTGKISFILLSILSIPLIVNIKDVFTLWLGEYPPYTTELATCLLLANVLDGFSAPLWTTISATGKVKTYTIILTIGWITILPISYWLLDNGFSPIYCYTFSIYINAVMIFFRLYLLNIYINIPIKYFCIEVVGKGILFFIISYTISELIKLSNHNLLIRLAGSIFLSAVTTVLTCYLIYLNRIEKKRIMNFIKLKKK
ncbi:oligosaccharide flippase family protein [Phocaeicola barnesiae]|uniref:oligosaccharide flippase family protein n=1 Tax=Phocaeicola barnesiae TaxID=376804 RepID=UPI0025A36419|nr:oligosaccharide flippase family protein [Phocaeicola barnesiae]MDM8310365.1 oligosaccharide flippase family protein [Phocaeicola barnesiae]